MTDRMHLQPKHREALEVLLREHLPDVEVWAYGSRVNGRSHDGSDLDLVLRGPELEEIPVGNMAHACVIATVAEAHNLAEIDRPIGLPLMDEPQRVCAPGTEQRGMSIDTTFLRRCIGTLETAFGEIDNQRATDDFMYDIYRAACVKEFELVLEQSGKLLRKRLAAFFASNRQADRLAFKDLFRHAARHGLIEAVAAERWFSYRDNRNDTAHDYGAGFAETPLKLLPDFIADARALADMIEAAPDD